MLRYLLNQSDRQIDIIRKRLVAYVTIGAPREMQDVLRRKLKILTNARRLTAFHLLCAPLIHLSKVALSSFWIDFEIMLSDIIFSALALFICRPRDDKTITIYLGEDGRMVVPIDQSPQIVARSTEIQENQTGLFRFEAILFNQVPKLDYCPLAVGYLQN
jgi:hypothetical protein